MAGRRMLLHGGHRVARISEGCFCRFIIQSPCPRSCWCADVLREQGARMLTVAQSMTTYI
eukprot:scaffold526418_cov17-Prasinocladus_malaysianus.AAC.1